MSNTIGAWMGPDNGEGQGMAVKGADEASAGFPHAGMVEQRPSERVVLRGVQVIVLDDLKDGDRQLIQELGLEGIAVAVREAWITEAMAPGSFDAAIEAHAGRSGEEGNKPGRYRAVKKAAWLEKGPRVIEPPLT